MPCEYPGCCFGTPSASAASQGQDSVHPAWLLYRLCRRYTRIEVQDMRLLLEICTRAVSALLMSSAQEGI